MLLYNAIDDGQHLTGKNVVFTAQNHQITIEQGNDIADGCTDQAGDFINTGADKGIARLPGGCDLSEGYGAGFLCH